MQINPDDYFDLTNEENDLDTVAITRRDNFNCDLSSTQSGELYKGFILAKTPAGNGMTVCDVDFQKSQTDQKYQPRIIFRKIDRRLQDATLRADLDRIRIPFADGQDGYRNLWRMIAYLYRFKESVDFGDFERHFQVMSAEQVTEYLNDHENMESIRKLAADMNTEVSAIMKPASSLKLLKEARDKLKEFIDNDASETEVQNWIDENKRERCIIFGLEYIDFKREGHTSSKRFDVLTRIGERSLEHILIELKSPGKNIFKVTTTQTENGSSTEYALHSDIARAIPQILEYKSILESKNPGDPELSALNINEKITIKKCIIVVGKNSNDARWKQNRSNISSSLSSNLEIWTYDDLLDKLESTISNLENLADSEVEATSF